MGEVPYCTIRIRIFIGNFNPHFQDKVAYMTSSRNTQVSPIVEQNFPHSLWNLELGRILLVQAQNIEASDELLDPTPMELEIIDGELSLAYANSCLQDFYSNWEIMGNPGSFELTQGVYTKILMKVKGRDPWMTVARKKMS